VLPCNGAATAVALWRHHVSYEVTEREFAADEIALAHRLSTHVFELFLAPALLLPNKGQGLVHLDSVRFDVLLGPFKTAILDAASSITRRSNSPTGALNNE
jgi:hypothetical protein